MIYKYLYPKPQFPIPGWLLTALVPVGLFSLWMSAYQAFQNVTEWWLHAAGLATLIEGGAFVTAFVWAKKRGWKNWESAGMVIMILTSASYQYTQASQAAAGISLIFFEVYALAWGPLVALVLIAFVLANIDTVFQKALSDWQENKTAWEIDKQTETEAEARRLADARKLRLQGIEDEQRVAKEADEVEARRIAEDERLYRQAAETNRIAEENRIKEADRNRRIRQENKARKLNQQPESVPVTTGRVAEVVKVLPELPEWITRKPKDKPDFIKMAKAGEVDLREITGPKLAAITGMGARAMQTWASDARKAIETNGHKKEMA